MQSRTESWTLCCFITAALVLTLSAFAFHSAAMASTLDEIIKKATQEGRIVVQMSEPLRGSTAEANRRMAAGPKQTFGVDVKTTIHRLRDAIVRINNKG